MTPAPAGQLTTGDRLDLIERLSLYGLLIDDHDWPGLSRVFLADAVFDVTDIGLEPARSLAEIVTMMEGVRHPLAHLVTNAVIESYAGGEARTRCRLIGVGHDLSVHVGQYRDVFVRTPHGWRIRHRTYTSVPPGAVRAVLLNTPDGPTGR